MIALDAYAADCRLYGHVEIGDGRMTDALNASPVLHVQEARLESLGDGRIVELPEITVAFDELCAVVANGPRGDMERRLRTRAIRVEVDTGPYHIEGAVHGTPASDPVIASFRRAAWVPLTEVTVRYKSGEESLSEEVTTLIVNRDLARLFRAIEEEAAVLPWETNRPLRPAVARALDLTDAYAGEDVRDRAEAAAAAGKAQEPLV